MEERTGDETSAGVRHPLRCMRVRRDAHYTLSVLSQQSGPNSHASQTHTHQKERKERNTCKVETVAQGHSCQSSMWEKKLEIKMEKKKNHTCILIFFTSYKQERREEVRHEKITQKKIHDDIFQLHIKSI